MADIVDPATRSRMMAGIRGKNTRPEVFIRSALHRAGFRFRLHGRDLPGTPDIILPKYRTVIFVNGCFWHRHENCHYASVPAVRQGFWQEKFEATRRRDLSNRALLLDAGWRVITIWECGIRHEHELLVVHVVAMLRASWYGDRELPVRPSKP
jgi:DNA mismatch endonuclease (patch repair protein)